MDRFILGTWGLSGPIKRQGKTLYYGHYDETDSLTIFDLAASLGIRLIDTAPSYGDGNGYTLIKTWQQKNKNAFGLIIKVGRPVINQLPTAKFEPEMILNEIESIIHGLDLPYAILIKDPPVEFFYQDRLNRLLTLIQDQYPRVRVGFASHLIFDCQKIVCPGKHRIAQIEYNGINFHFADQAIKQLKAQDWEIWSMQPLAYGFLSGKYNNEINFSENDWRHYLTKDKQYYLQRCAKKFLNLFTADAKNYPNAEIATAFCLVHPFIDKVIFGPKTAKQLLSTMRALKLANEENFISFCKQIRERTVIF